MLIIILSNKLTGEAQTFWENFIEKQSVPPNDPHQYKEMKQEKPQIIIIKKKIKKTRKCIYTPPATRPRARLAPPTQIAQTTKKKKHYMKQCRHPPGPPADARAGAGRAERSPIRACFRRAGAGAGVLRSLGWQTATMKIVGCVWWKPKRATVRLYRDCEFILREACFGKDKILSTSRSAPLSSAVY